HSIPCVARTTLWGPYLLTYGTRIGDLLHRGLPPSRLREMSTAGLSNRRSKNAQLARRNRAGRRHGGGARREFDRRSVRFAPIRRAESEQSLRTRVPQRRQS